jgi:hypothetical protein
VAIVIVVVAIVVRTTLIADAIEITAFVIRLPAVVAVVADRFIQLVALVPNLP